MTPNQFRAQLEQLLGARKTAERAAVALNCSERCVFYWLAGERQIPGPVISAIELARACPPELLPEAWKASPARRARNGLPAAPPADRRGVIGAPAARGAEHP